MAEVRQTVLEAVLEEIRAKSKKAIYKRDPEAWLWDVLGKRWWSKQREIVASVVNPDKSKTFTLVKSANGIGKTALGADLMTWAISANDPFETTVIATANQFSQIKDNAFRYIADNYSLARAKGLNLPGSILGGNTPVVRLERGKGLLPKDVVIARRPADANLLSSFQGTHDGYVFVLLDEAGGLPEELWIGAYAVTTNQNTAILALGNPDDLYTPFWDRFTDEERYSDWSKISVSAFDTPNFTGEIIHPEDPERDREVKAHLVQTDWAETMKREAHPNVYRAKVLGEFPESGDTSFFSASVVATADNTEIDPDESDVRVLGVDLAFGGEDLTVAYLNHGGRVRKFAEWQYEEDTYRITERVHELALSSGADVLCVDAGGAGRGVHNMLLTRPEFVGPYELVGVDSGASSPDPGRWSRWRTYLYDEFRRKIQLGEIDLDLSSDTKLRDQMVKQTYEITPRGSLQVTSKRQMSKSPDELDACIYATAGAEVPESAGQKPKLVASGFDEVQGFELVSHISQPGWPL